MTTTRYVAPTTRQAASARIKTVNRAGWARRQASARRQAIPIIVATTAIALNMPQDESVIGRELATMQRWHRLFVRRARRGGSGRGTARTTLTFAAGDSPTTSKPLAFTRKGFRTHHRFRLEICPATIAKRSAIDVYNFSFASQRTNLRLMSPRTCVSPLCLNNMVAACY
jgi:hypothetical protein